MEEWTNGKIVEETEEGYLILVPKVEEIKEFGIKECLVKLLSPYLVTEEQRKKAWVLITDIAEGTNRWGKLKDAVHKEMKQKFCEQYDVKSFSLSNCSRATATKYIEFLVSYILENNIPSSVLEEDFDDSTSKMMYARFMSDKCMICDNEVTRYYVDDSGILKLTDFEKLESGEKIYFLCDKHGDYLEKKGKSLFNQIYIIEPLNVSDNMRNKEKGMEEEDGKRFKFI